MFYSGVSVLCVLFLLCANLSHALIPKPHHDSGSNDTLRLVHVLFRHGDRTNDASTTYPKDPHINYTYPPFGIGQLTNRGKQREYRIGKYLRERYNSFLGDLYTPDVLEAITTDTNRTKMSLELVLAGAYPPMKTPLEWDSELNWQPIPYNHIPPTDKLMMLSFFYCPNYIKEYNAYVNSPAGSKVQQKYTELYSYLTENTGMTINTTSGVYMLYFGLTTEQECGLELPSWTIPVYPGYIEEATIDQYKLFSATTKLKQLSGGFPLKKIIENMKSKISKTLKPRDRKLFLYSGHEMNVAYLLNAMEVFKPHVPPYGAHILIELHEINKVYGVKIFYQDYTAFEPGLLKVPGCQNFCPFEKFVQLLQKNLPADGNVCGDDFTVVHEEKHHRLHFLKH